MAPDNRIHDAGFTYDANGNLSVAPTDGVSAPWLYRFDGLNRPGFPGDRFS
jgi:hypothetical protein